MFKKIVIGYDGSDQARDAVAFAQLLARTTGAELVAAAVWHPLSGMPNPAPYGRYEELEREQTGRTAEEVGGVARTEVVRSHSTAGGLHDLAEREAADLIVVGSSHRSRAGRTLAGTVGVGLLNGSPAAVAVAPAGFRDTRGEPPHVIGVGYDGGAESEAALEGAIELARAMGARLHVLTVARPPESGFEGKGYQQAGREELVAAVTDRMREVLDRALASVPDDIEADGELITDTQDMLGHRDGIELMVLGSRGYGPARRVMLGSSSAQLLRDAPCPAIVFPRGAKTATSAAPQWVTAGAER